MSRTPQQALKDAMESGAIQAWLDGKEIEYQYLNNGDWKCMTDTLHYLADPRYQWRPKPEPPPEPPVVKWINIKDQKPKHADEYLVCGLFSSITRKTIRTAYWNALSKMFVGFPEVQHWSPMPNLPQGD